MIYDQSIQNGVPYMRVILYQATASKIGHALKSSQYFRGSGLAW